MGLRLFLAEDVRDFPFRSDLLVLPSNLGVAPFFIGVCGGSSLSKCSGLRLGPNDTRFLLAADITADTSLLRFLLTAATAKEGKNIN